MNGLFRSLFANFSSSPPFHWRKGAGGGEEASEAATEISMHVHHHNSNSDDNNNSNSKKSRIESNRNDDNNNNDYNEEWEVLSPAPRYRVTWKLPNNNSKSEILNKWREEFLPHYEACIDTKEMRDYWRSGIPNVVRGRAWMKRVGNRLNLQCDDFVALAKSGKMGAGRIELDADVPRTSFDGKFPDRNQLVAVLDAASKYQADVGYVQGMSFVAAMLLTQQSPGDAFITLCNLLQQHHFMSFYLMKMEDINLRWETFNILLVKLDPDLCRYMADISVPHEIFLTHWWFTIYSKDFSLSVASRIWDCFLLDGEAFLFLCALSVLQLLRPQILECTSPDQVMDIMDRANTLVNENDLFQVVNDCRITLYDIQLLMKQKKFVK